MTDTARTSAYPVTVQPGIPRLGKIPHGWSRSAIGQHLVEVRRPVKMDDDTTYDLVTVKRARGGVVKRETLEGRNISVKSQFEIHEGDFLISKRQIVHGACGVVPTDLHGSTVSNEYSVLRPRDTIDLQFLKYLSHSIHFQQTCFHSSIGVHVEKMIFKLDKWFEWRFDLPPIEEQWRIAEILGTWDRAIETTEKLIDASEAQKKALMQQLLTGHKRLPGFEGEWRSSQVGKHCDITSGPAFKSSGFSAEGPLLLRGSNVKRGEIIWDDKITERWPTTQGWEKYLLQKDDIVVAMDGYVGRSHAFVHENPALPILLVQRVARIRPTAIDPNFLYALISSENFHRHCESNKTATGIAHISLKDIREFSVLLPDRAEQEAIGLAIRTATNTVELLRSKLETLISEKAALIQQLLTGKRRVNTKEMAA